MLVSWFTSVAFEKSADYHQHATTLSRKTGERWLRNWVQRSKDCGQTWGEPIRINASAPHGPIQLRDGRLLYLDVGSLNGEHTIVAEESTDNGHSWNVIGTVYQPTATAHRGLGEPHLAKSADGTLIGLFRIGGDDMENRFLYQSESNNRGYTWTPAQVISMLGFSPYLTSLHNGHLSGLRTSVLPLWGASLSQQRRRSYLEFRGRTRDLDCTRTTTSDIQHRCNWQTARC